MSVMTEWDYWRGYTVNGDTTDSAVVGLPVLELNLSPRCLRCGSAAFVVRIPYSSIHDGEYICAKCLDALLARDDITVKI